MFGIEVRRGEFPVHFGVDSRDREADTSQHVVCCHIVDVILVHFGADNHPIIVLLFATSS